MPLELTQLDRTPLRRTPLTLVVCQLRYETNLAVARAETAFNFHEELGGRDGDYPEIAPFQGVSVDIQLQGEPSIAQQNLGGWQITSRDGQTVLSLMSDHVAIETGEYGGWAEDFRPRLEAVLAAVSKWISPIYEERLGLRYVNQIFEPEVADSDGFREWISPELLGIVAHPQLAEDVVQARQQVLVGINSEVRGAVNHGLIPDPAREGKPTYILDYDIFRQGRRQFDPAAILRVVDDFNTYALALFQLSVTQSFREYCSR